MQRKTILAIAVISLFIGTTAIPVSAMLTKSHSETTLQTQNDPTEAYCHFKWASVQGKFQRTSFLNEADSDDDSVWDYIEIGLYTHCGLISNTFPFIHRVRPGTEAKFVGMVDAINNQPVEPYMVTINAIGESGDDFTAKIIGRCDKNDLMTAIMWDLNMVVVI